MTKHDVTTILVPGAWMGAWIWQPTVDSLAARGIDASTLTLAGLDDGATDEQVAAVRLDDHVQQLVDLVDGMPPSRVVLVSHSYSSMVTASAADRLGDAVAGLVHIGGFVPVHGRSLLDDWGDSADERADELQAIVDAGHRWLPPEPAMLEHVPDLAADDRELLGTRLAAHPGRTVTDEARLAAPAATQPTTYVALSQHDSLDEAWRDVPDAVADATGWRRRHIVSGHWPMLSAHEATVDVLVDEITHHAAAAG